MNVRLMENGIRTCGELRDSSLEILQTICGPHLGDKLRKLASGIDSTRINPTKEVNRQSTAVFSKSVVYIYALWIF